MNNKIPKILSSLVFSLLLTLVCSVQYVSAQSASNSNGQALEIGPTVIALEANQGEIVRADIKIRNISSGPLIVNGEINDFVAGGEDGTPKILLEESEINNNQYSMRNWISPLPELNLISKQIETQSVIISIPTDAAPGGYYGVIRFTSTPSELEGSGVSLSASLGSLILLKINGEVKEKLTMEEFYATQNGGTSRSIFEDQPIQFIARIKNEGNIHEQPSGQITITDMFNNKIASVNVNLNKTKNNVLPNSIRKYEQVLDNSVIGNKMLFGRYKAEIKLTYGANDQEIIQTIDFWVIPYTKIIVAVIALIAGFFIFRFTIRSYNKRIVAKALKSRKNSKH